MGEIVVRLRGPLKRETGRPGKKTSGGTMMSVNLSKTESLGRGRIEINE